MGAREAALGQSASSSRPYQPPSPPIGGQIANQERTSNLHRTGPSSLAVMEALSATDTIPACIWHRGTNNLGSVAAGDVITPSNCMRRSPRRACRLLAKLYHWSLPTQISQQLQNQVSGDVIHSLKKRIGAFFIHRSTSLIICFIYYKYCIRSLRGLFKQYIEILQVRKLFLYNRYIQCNPLHSNFLDYRNSWQSGNSVLELIVTFT